MIKPVTMIAAEITGESPCTALWAPAMTSPKLDAHSTAPSRSNGLSCGSGSGSARPKASEISPNGTAAAKIHGQYAKVKIRPPTVGASAAEQETTTLLTPRPRPSWEAGWMGRSVAEWQL